MLKITFLGTCAGTEPIPGRHHSSFVLEAGGLCYFFDAGENCSHKAAELKIDVTKTRAVFISHMHIDHTGGLANLLFTVHKLASRYKKPHVNGNSYDVFIPDTDVFQSIKQVAFYGGKAGGCVKINEHPVHDGLIYEDENLRVTALHNTHLGETGKNGFHSYSYLIEAEGKRIVCSGDVSYPEELNRLIADGCDCLIMETGHHTVTEVCEYAKAHGVKRLLFTHNGREILGDVKAAEERASALHGNAAVCYDGFTELLHF